MAKKNQTEKQSFTCYNCKKLNTFNQSEYMADGEEFLLEAAGTPPTKEIIISCEYCKAENEITITL